MPREFEDKPAVRSHVPLLVGLTGCSGSGKSFSALRLASGIQQVAGGDIFAIDTEARRLLHYADKFKFRHVEFHAPFGSLDYLEAIRYCVNKGAKTIIIDSMSHEHEGPGGMLDLQDQEFQRLGGKDSVKMLAWVKPKQARRALINGILQLEVNMIFCFRAKSVTKPVKNSNGKVEMVPQGFEPIAGQEFVYEQTVSFVLLPKANGIPTWNSEKAGEAMTMKLPEQFRRIFEDHQPLSEDLGRRMAEWARGSAEICDLDAAMADGLAAANKGSDALKAYFVPLPATLKKALKPHLDKEWKAIAAAADKRATDPDGDPEPEPEEEPGEMRPHGGRMFPDDGPYRGDS